MTIMSGLGIVLSLVFAGVLLALFAELYYLLWWKKQRVNHNRSEEEEDEDTSYSNNSRELLYFFCLDKPNSEIVPNPEEEEEEHPEDVELGLGLGLEEDDTESDIMRLYNLVGPPRFLFTIKEETKEELDSEDGKSRSRSLSDLIVGIENRTPNFSPLASPQCSNLANYSNPLFESELLTRLRSSPPPKFKFLRDAEEKLYRKLMEEAKKREVLQLPPSENKP